MIPMLFDSTAILPDRYNGVLTLPSRYMLSDCITAEVSEELNGKYEMTIKYPVNGVNFEQIKVCKIIAATPNQYRLNDPDEPWWKLDYFFIYRIEIELGKIATIKCEHMSYALSKMRFPALPETKKMVDFIQKAQAGVAHFGFMITAEVFPDTQENFFSNGSRNCRDMLVGTSNSILTHWQDAQIEFIHYEARILHSRARHENPWRLQVGTNLKNMKVTYDATNQAERIFSYYIQNGINQLDDDQFDSFVDTYPNRYLFWNSEEYFKLFNKPAPTTQQALWEATGWKMNQVGSGNMPTIEVQVTPDLADAPEIVIGDPVLVIAEDYGIAQESIVKAYTWDVLNDRYNSLTIGTIQKNLGNILNEIKGGK